MLLILVSLIMAERSLSERDISGQVLYQNINESMFENGYLVPKHLDPQNNDNDFVKIYSEDDTISISSEHIYEEIPGNEPYYDKLDFIGTPLSCLNVPEEEAPYPNVSSLHLGDILFKGQSIYRYYKLFVDSCKKRSKEFHFACLDAVRLSEEDFDTFAKIKFRSSLSSQKMPKSHLFFVEFKRLLIEIIYFLEDRNTALRLKFNNRTREQFDALFVALIKCFTILIDKNNFHEYIRGRNFVEIEKKSIDDNFALELLGVIFRPKKFIDRSDKTVKWLLHSLSKNAKSYSDLERGFDVSDMIQVKIGSKTRYYPARYYVVASIFSSFLINN